MRFGKSVRPTLEQLESRWCPSANFTLDKAGNLTIVTDNNPQMVTITSTVMPDVFRVWQDCPPPTSLSLAILLSTRGTTTTSSLLIPPTAGCSGI